MACIMILLMFTLAAPTHSVSMHSSEAISADSGRAGQRVVVEYVTNQKPEDAIDDDLVVTLDDDDKTGLKMPGLLIDDAQFSLIEPSDTVDCDHAIFSKSCNVKGLLFLKDGKSSKAKQCHCKCGSEPDLVTECGASACTGDCHPDDLDNDENNAEVGQVDVEFDWESVEGATYEDDDFNFKASTQGKKITIGVATQFLEFPTITSAVTGAGFHVAANVNRDFRLHSKVGLLGNEANDKDPASKKITHKLEVDYKSANVIDDNDDVDFKDSLSTI